MHFLSVISKKFILYFGTKLKQIKMATKEKVTQFRMTFTTV